MLDSGSRVYGSSDSLTRIVNVPFMGAVGSDILQKPVVPLSPAALKLIAVPLNLKSDIVELEMA